MLVRHIKEVRIGRILPGKTANEHLDYRLYAAPALSQDVTVDADSQTLQDTIAEVFSLSNRLFTSGTNHRSSSVQGSHP